MNQIKLLHAFLSRLRCLSATWVLPFCWVLGLLLGTLYGYCADRSYVLFMRIATTSSMSILGLLFVLYIPLLFSVFAVYFKRPQWLVPICFAKAFLFASCGCALFIVFGSAAWLVRLLLQFSDLCSIPFLYWFCMRNITGRNSNTQSDFLVCCAAAAIIGIFDFGVISPYLVKLIDI